MGILARPTFPGTSFYASKTISEHIRNAFPYACENPSEWMNKINRMYVTGASLVAQLEEQRQQEDVDPLDGETVYSFGGMPFHYLESVPEEGKAPDSDGMSVDDM